MCNPDPTANLGNNFWEGGGDDGGEGISKFERLGGDGDNNGLGAAAIQLFGARQQPRRRASMGKCRGWRGLWADDPAMDLTRPALGVSIDENGATRVTKGLGKLRGKLMTGHDFHIQASEHLGKQAAGVPAKRVITSQRIAVSNN